MPKNPLNLEIERGWLLKSMPPNVVYDRTIKQYYFEENGIFKRVRESLYPNGNITYHQTIKTPREGGKIGFIEDEHEISFSEFMDKLKIAHSFIHKDRFIRICDVNRGLKWEFDNFISITMIKGELELPNDNIKIEIPQDIQDCIIFETTGISEFSNAKLAKKIGI